MRTRADRMPHEIPRILGERLHAGSRPGNRTDGLRVVLAIEGGGMRGTVSAGMALALHELGLMPAFDAVYGASAGAITGAWLLSSNPEGLRGWAEPSYAKTLIRWSSVLRGRPVVDIRTLIEVVYQTEWPMDFASVLASAVEYHPLATDAATGESTDLRPLIADPAELRLALRASASLPFLAGPPVRLRDRRFYDAGVAESIPFRTPLAQGATHVLVLRSRLAAGAATRREHRGRRRDHRGRRQRQRRRGEQRPTAAPASFRPAAGAHHTAQRVARTARGPVHPERPHGRRRRAHRRARGRRPGAVYPAFPGDAAGQPAHHGRPPARGRLRGGPPGRPGHIRALGGVIHVTSPPYGGTIRRTVLAREPTSRAEHRPTYGGQ